jgi:hypothetical protein
MEKVYQPIGPKGLQIPLVFIRQYGLEQGSDVAIEMHTDGIRIVPAHPNRTTIENHALRYLLAWVGDAVTVDVTSLPDHAGWQVHVYGVGYSKPAGRLFYSSAGDLLPERSTPPAEIRRTILDASEPV